MCWGPASFDDVPAGHWADEEIGWAVANGITQGVGDGLFDMGRVVTRVQIAAFMFRVARVVKPADPPVVGVSSSLERCASAGSPGSGVLAVLAGTAAGGVYPADCGSGQSRFLRADHGMVGTGPPGRSGAHRPWGIPMRIPFAAGGVRFRRCGPDSRFPLFRGMLARASYRTTLRGCIRIRRTAPRSWKPHGTATRRRWKARRPAGTDTYGPR